MFIKDISEAENVVNLLNNDNKQKTLTQITQILVNGVAQSHTADPFSVVSRILAVLPKDTQQKVLEELNWNVLRQLHIQSIPVFPIFNKLATTLNEEVKQSVMSEISLLLQNSIKSNNATTAAQTSPPSRPNTTPPSAPPSAPTQTIGQPASPPQAPNFNSSGVHQMNTVKKFIPTMPAPSAPPSTLPPRPSGNTVEMKFSKGLTLTGTFNLKPKDPVDKANSKTIMSINETLKYIIPVHTENAKKTLSN